MYATHETLVDHESYTFMKRGFDVYTAAWATNTRSMYSVGEPIVLNPRHPYKGTCSFLSADDIKVLSKIDINMTHAKYYPDVQEVLLNKFDVLYVFQITPWLLLYANEFLKHNKPVIFRTSGYPLGSWGQPSDISGLLKHPLFSVVITDIEERPTYPTVQIMASIHPDLIDCESKLENCGRFMLSVGGASLSAEERAKAKLKPTIDWVLINRNVRFTSNADCDKLFNSCYIFFDMTDSLIKYSVLEALLHGKAVLSLKGKSIHRFMSNVNVRFEYWHNGFDDVDKIRFYVNNPGAVYEVYQAQRYWFNNLLAESELKWDKFIEERL